MSASLTTGFSPSLALYLQEKLNFSTEQTGTLTGLFGGMVWFMAMFGGAAADRLGFRRALSVAYLILAAAYFLIGSIAASWLAPVRNAVPLGLFVGFILVLPALGVALVKPCVVGTTARASKENVRSIGYSIYYTMVNIGGALGPLYANWAHQHLGVENVYRVAAISVFVMFFVVVIFFREPRKINDAPPPSISEVARNFCIVVGRAWLVLPAFAVALALYVAMFFSSHTAPWWVWIVILGVALAGASRFLWFLLIFTGYWIVFWQQYIILPGYILHYVDSKAPAELVLVTDGLTVICLTLAVNYLTRQDPGIPGGHSRDSDHFYFVDHSRSAADGMGRGAVAVRARAGRDHPGAALLRIYFAARSPRTTRHVHGICVSSDWNWLADRREGSGECSSITSEKSPTARI